MAPIARAARAGVRVLAVALCGASAAADVVRDGSLGAAPAGVVPSGIDPNGQFATYLITPELGAGVPAAAPRNLYHSFSEFDLTPGEIATFTGPASVVNVFGRVTGGAPSDINGTVRSTIDGANVFLLNPFGVVFGPDAQLDVRGSVVASSADAVRFANGADFVTGTPVANGALLSIEDPTAFGFMRATPGAIEIDRALPTLGDNSLTVPSGETLALIGGDVRVTGRGFNVPTVVIDGGNFEVASVRGPAEVPADVSAFRVAGVPREQLGDVTFTNQAIIDVSELFSGTGAGGGRVVVRGGQLTIDEQSSVTTATLFDADAPAVGIDVAVAGDFVVAGVPGLGVGPPNTLVRTTSLLGAGRGADLSIEADRFIVRDGALVSTETFAGSGAGGDLRIQANSVRVEGDARVDTTTGEGSGTGRGGDLRIEAGTIEVADGVVRTVTLGGGPGGDLALVADDVLVEGGEVSALGAQGPGGDLRIEGDEVAVRAGGLVSTQALGDESAGQISIEAGKLEVSGSLSGIAALGAPSISGATGAGGPIAISARQVALRDGGVLTVSAQGNGGAGRIDIDADVLKIDGVDASGNRSGVFANALAGARGDAGQIDLSLGALSIQNGGQISATSTSDLGGLPGTVRIQAGDVWIANSQDAIRAESLSPSNAGDIEIVAANRVEIRDATISTQASLAGGGNIEIRAGDMILLRQGVGDPSLDPAGAAVRANVLGVGAQGGNVRLAAPVVALDRDGVVANAPAGAGGSIAIDADAFFVPGGALTEVSDGLFVASGSTFLDVSGALDQGELEVRSPDAAIVTQIAALRQDFLDVTRLATNECAAREGRVGSLVVRGRDRSPASPAEELRIFYDEPGSAQ